MFDLTNLSKVSEKPSAELCLYYERLRSQVVNGISSYSLHPKDGSFLLTSGAQLHCYQVLFFYIQFNFINNNF